MESAERFDLLSNKGLPSGPLALDVLDLQGRLVMRAGTELSETILDRLRKMGILEVYIATPEASESGFWERWGQNWIRNAQERLALLDACEAGRADELASFKKVLQAAVTEFVAETDRGSSSRP